MLAPYLEYSRDINEFRKLLSKKLNGDDSWFSRFTSDDENTSEPPPSVILTEGDSWFDYPIKSLTDVMGVLLKYTVGLKNFGFDSLTNIIDHLAADEQVNGLFLRLERSGDTSPDLKAKESDGKCGVREKEDPSSTLYAALIHPDIAQHTRFILLSAGGNDMVNYAQKHSILEFKSSWQDSYDHVALTEEASRVVENYLGAIQLRDQYAPQAKIITHSYCYAVHTSIGSPVEFDLSTANLAIKGLLSVLNLNWLRAPLRILGVNVNDMGDVSVDSEAHLHKIFDEKGWPKNEGATVHPERQAFIRCLMDELYEQMSQLPEKYKTITGSALERFEFLDIRDECQHEKYWADYIHLNPLGYEKVKEHFKRKVLES